VFHSQSDYDNFLTPSDSEAGAAPGVYVWTAPDKRVAIHLKLDVVDSMQQDVMRGFGAVPKRGAEVGGILLGSARREGALVVRVDDFELVPVEYRHGPSYLMSDTDRDNFREALERVRADAGRPAPVGFFRSQTRDGVGLGTEDRELLERFFPGTDAVVLLIRPFATKPSMAGFYVQENGTFPEGPPLEEFPFRRKELAPDEAEPAVRRSPGEPRSPRLLGQTRREAVRSAEVEAPAPATVPAPAPAPEAKTEPPKSVEPDAPPAVESARRRSWSWIPVSLLFLLLGVGLGFWTALTLRPAQRTIPAETFRLSLTAVKTGDNLHVKWDRQAAAIRAAERGVLTIDDGTFTKTLDLDAGQLQNGSVVYKHYSNDVRFRLQVFPNSRDSVMETLEWKR